MSCNDVQHKSMNLQVKSLPSTASTFCELCNLPLYYKYLGVQLLSANISLRHKIYWLFNCDAGFAWY